MVADIETAIALCELKNHKNFTSKLNSSGEVQIHCEECGGELLLRSNGTYAGMLIDTSCYDFKKWYEIWKYLS